MGRLFLVLFLPAIALVGFCSRPVAGDVNSMGPAPNIRVASIRTAATAAKPESRDFKKQVLLTKLPLITETKTVPNLDPLIDQLMRHSDLNYSAMKIMPWVYTSTTEMVVADYEDALARLDLADECLLEAMQSVLYEPSSLETNHSLAQAMLELDDAEVTILLLVEIAKLEL